MGDAEYKDCVQMLGNPVGKLAKATTWTTGKSCKDEKRAEMAQSHINIEGRCLITAVLTWRHRLGVLRT